MFLREDETISERTLDEFLADDLVHAAVIRCIEVIGEAARLSPRRRAIARQ